MINFNENEIQKINLFHELKKKYKERELEIIFSSIKHKNRCPITRNSFINMLKTMKNSCCQDSEDKEWIKKEQTTSLDIRLHRTKNIDNNDNLKNIRITIIGSENISIYCKYNNINKIPNEFLEIMYKKFSIISDEDKDILDFTNTSDNFQRGLAIDIENYDIRFTLKDEILYKKGSFVSNNVRLKKEANNIWNEVNNNLDNYFKTFRLKNRYSFISTTTNIQLDLTIVQSSFEDINGRNLSIPVKEFFESKLLESEKKYEIELELSENTNIQDINKKIEFVLSNMNKYPLVISNKEENDILNIYKLFIRNNLETIAKNKITILENIQKIETNKEKEKEIDDLINQCKKIDEQYYNKIIENKLQLSSEILVLKEFLNHKKYNKDNIFKIGPKPITLNIFHINKSQVNSIINNNYTVTDKADGLGKYLYIVGTDHLHSDIKKNKSFYLDNEKLQEYNKYIGKIYLIDNNLKVYSTNLKISQSKNYGKYCNSLLNGEFIDKDLNNKNIFKYVAYDIYFRSNNDIKKLPFMSRIDNVDTRLNELINLLKDSSNDFTVDTHERSSLEIKIKDFYLYTKDYDQDSKIFHDSNIVWSKFKNSETEYKYDGLIYTPSDHPVGYDNNNYNYDLNTGKTWDLNLKWKPEHENTIDFLLKEEKDEIANYNDYKINQSNIKTQTVKVGNEKNIYEYKTYNLYIGKNITEHINHCKTQINPNYKIYNKYEESRYLPTIFKPTKPFNDQAYIAKLKIDSKKKNVYGNRWNENIKFSDILLQDGSVIERQGDWEITDDIITDDTIVEFLYQNYDISDERYIDNEHFRWIPIRTRHDKTYQYKKAILKQQNIYNDLMKYSKLKIEEIDPSFYKINLKPIIDKAKISNISNSSNEFEHFKNFKINIDQIKKYFPDYTYIPLDSRSHGVSINYGNDFNTANSNWNVIHNPITEHMITTGKNIPISDEFNEDEKYYRRDLSQIRDKSLTINLQNFHNKIIKNDLLYTKICNAIRNNTLSESQYDQSTESKDKYISLLDLATGKGGDIPKWISNNINFIVGIDIFKNNIYDEIDGACVRRNNLIIKSNKIKRKYPEISFLLGDVSKNIINGSAFPSSDFISTALWNKIWNNDSFSYQNRKFDIISIMFAIHYFFSDEDKLNSLIENIDQNLKPNGYLIGTCFDGEQIFNYLNDIKYNEYKEGRIEDNLIWRITKKYSDEYFENSEKSLGMKIDVYIRSINQVITEYLVNFDYFKNKLEEKGIKLLTNEEAKKLDLPIDNKEYVSHGSFEIVYNKNENLLEKVKKLSSDERKISNLNKYFIFKKEYDVKVFADQVVKKIHEIYNKAITNVRNNDLKKWIIPLRNYDKKKEEILKLIKEYYYEKKKMIDEAWIIIDKSLHEDYINKKFNKDRSVEQEDSDKKKRSFIIKKK